MMFGGFLPGTVLDRLVESPPGREAKQVGCRIPGLSNFIEFDCTDVVSRGRRSSCASFKESWLGCKGRGNGKGEQRAND